MQVIIAIPKTGAIKTVADLNGKKIATSYPLILSNYLKEKNINATIQEISGSVEIAPKIGLAKLFVTWLVQEVHYLVMNLKNLKQF
jgi:ATP phosphoribosyltransferase